MDVDKILQDEARRLENLRKNAKKHYYAHKDELLAKQKIYRKEKKEKVEKIEYAKETIQVCVNAVEHNEI